MGFRLGKDAENTVRGAFKYEGPALTLANHVLDTFTQASYAPAVKDIKLDPALTPN